MTALEALQQAIAAGLEVSRRSDGVLYVEPADLLTPELRAALTVAKPQILALLHQAAATSNWALARARATSLQAVCAKASELAAPAAMKHLHHSTYKRHEK